jgi:hypothetical protein
MTRALFVAALLVLAVAPLKAGHNPAVTIRTYNYAQVDYDALLNARSVVDRIFGSAGVALEWTDCRVPQRDVGAACIAPLDEGRDFIVRLMESAPDSATADGRIHALGTSMLDLERRSGVLITIDVLRVRAIAGGASVDMSSVLGRAIAHEIGHLLLGTALHPATGLMRGHWSHDELRGATPAYWGFSPREAAQMRRGLASRTPAAN